ncbi:MAG: proline dehydrogenase family protein [Bdellovibrionales bacterium]|nr:proline dehydrogenase family protein [Bdellovibrionales bacterium]
MRSPTVDEKQLESEIASFGAELFSEIQSTPVSLFDQQGRSAKLMDWAMEDEDFKISLFRFVDVLPALRSSAEVVRHAQEYFESAQHRIPGLLKWGMNVDPQSITSKVAAQFIRSQVRSMAEQFILGETPKSALKPLRKIRKDGLAFTVDLVGEACVSEHEARIYLDRYLELLDTLSTEVPKWPESSPIIAGHRGEKTPINISVKLSALYSQAKAVNFERSVATLVERSSEILAKAKQIGAFVYFDMEDTPFTDIAIDTFKGVLALPQFKDYASCGLVLQAYLRRTEDDVAALIDWVRSRGTPIAVRLVKGAYWDTETILAKQRDWPIPVWQEKAASDACYERLTLTLLEESDLIMPAFGSHNIRSLVHAAKAAELMGVDKNEFEIQALYGMAEPIKKAFSKRGFLVRDYAPIGELIPGMGYLVRRLLENTSNEGFLRQGFREHEDPKVLLKKPVPDEEDSGEEHLTRDHRIAFANVPLTDFAFRRNRENLKSEINTLRSSVNETPRKIHAVIGGELVEHDTWDESHSPEDVSLKIAAVGRSSRADCDRALDRLAQYCDTWRATPVNKRAEVLFKAAELMDERRLELTALIILEAGKPWNEADADVAEAIDFCNYYAHQALSLFCNHKLGSYPGEENLLRYEPRGISAVISPWNFPLAIPCGMFVASLVTGNCTILKPAEQTPAIASALFDILLEAGLPENAAAFLPGIGEDIGSYLVRSERVSTIAFTGSKSVGLDIIGAAASVAPGQEHVKRAIIEMGGKNAIIVDSDADLDEAVSGVLYSAFGFQGQKCSACSRAIVHELVYDAFVERLSHAVNSIAVGPASDPATYVAPVIDKDSQDRLLAAIESGKSSCTLVVEGRLPSASAPNGYYVPPVVFADLPEGHDIVRKELFGPVLALIKTPSFAEGIRIAMDSEYGLTGGVFSRSPKNIELAANSFRVGNLYLNRGCTGALVMRQPFGGAKMSGVGSKAGGPDYLLQFTIPRAISENMMRRGFAPMQ